MTESIREQVLVALDGVLKGMSPAKGYRYEWYIHREEIEVRDDQRATHGKATAFVYATEGGFETLDSEFINEDLLVTIELRILHDKQSPMSAATVRDRMVSDVMKALGTKLDPTGAGWGISDAKCEPQGWETLGDTSENEVGASLELNFSFGASVTDPASTAHGGV